MGRSYRRCILVRSVENREAFSTGLHVAISGWGCAGSHSRGSAPALRFVALSPWERAGVRERPDQKLTVALNRAVRGSPTATCSGLLALDG